MESACFHEGKDNLAVLDDLGRVGNLDIESILANGTFSLVLYPSPPFTVHLNFDPLVPQ